MMGIGVADRLFHRDGEPNLQYQPFKSDIGSVFDRHDRGIGMSPRAFLAQVLGVMALLAMLVGAPAAFLLPWYPPAISAIAATLAAAIIALSRGASVAGPRKEEQDEFALRKQERREEEALTLALVAAGKGWVMVFILVFGAIEVHEGLRDLSADRTRRICAAALLEKSGAVRAEIDQAAICPESIR